MFISAAGIKTDAAAAAVGDSSSGSGCSGSNTFVPIFNNKKCSNISLFVHGNNNGTLIIAAAAAAAAAAIFATITIAHYNNLWFVRSINGTKYHGNVIFSTLLLLLLFLTNIITHVQKSWFKKIQIQCFGG